MTQQLNYYQELIDSLNAGMRSVDEGILTLTCPCRDWPKILPRIKDDALVAKGNQLIAQVFGDLQRRKETVIELREERDNLVGYFKQHGKNVSSTFAPKCLELGMRMAHFSSDVIGTAGPLVADFAELLKEAGIDD